jgi:ribonuclease PH
MAKTIRATEIQKLELQLEEAVQMLKLVAASKRTCIEVQEWLDLNYPENQSDLETVKILMNQKLKQ